MNPVKISTHTVFYNLTITDGNMCNQGLINHYQLIQRL